MYRSELEPITEESLISHDILDLYDEVAELNDYCAFLCDAVSCLVGESDCIDRATAQGLGRFSHDIKRGMDALKSKLRQIHEKEYTHRQDPKKATLCPEAILSDSYGVFLAARSKYTHHLLICK